MESFLSFKDQSRHYFDRPHQDILSKPLDHPAAWSADDIEGTNAWHYQLSSEEVHELTAALQFAKTVSKPLFEFTKEDFPLENLSGAIQRWRNAVQFGMGVQVVRGLPVHEWQTTDAEIVFWCLGLHMGRPGGQNVKQDLLGHVTDTGSAVNDSSVRLYETASNIAYHCDAADVVGLLCLKSAKSGGKSRIVSSVRVFNQLVAQSPDLAARLFDPVRLDIRSEGNASGTKFISVIPCRFDGSILRTFYHADYFRSVVRHAEIGRLSEVEMALYDEYEAIAADPRYYVEMDLQPGDIQFLSNHTMLHARTQYEDHKDPEQKRHLLRLWLSIMA